MTKIEGQARSIINDLELGKGRIIDLGHPLLNRIASSRPLGINGDGDCQIGAIQAVTREAYFTTVEGETNQKSLGAMVKRTGKESLQWGFAAGVYSGLTYRLKEARGARGWKKSTIAGALTGVALAVTSDDSSHDQVVQGAIIGAAISTAANLLTGIF